jgi:hypothetical protein
MGIRGLMMRSFRRRSSFAVRIIDGFGRRVDVRDVDYRETQQRDEPGWRPPPELEP